MRTLLAILFVLNSLLAFGHQDLTFSQNRGNVYSAYTTGFMGYEIHYNFDFLLDLTTQLVDVKKQTDIPIYIHFTHDYTNSQEPYYALSYGDFLYDNYEKEETGKVLLTGIKLIFQDSNFEIRAVLNLINSALSDIESLKKNQKELLIDSHGRFNGKPIFDTLYSISKQAIATQKSKTDKTVQQLINQKTHLKNPNEKQRKINYYYQNDSFHIYKTDHKTNKIILTVSTIKEILIGEKYDGNFLFINDSVFHYFPASMTGVREAVTIKNMKYLFHPIGVYYNEIHPQRFVFLIDNYTETKKVLYFPDGNVVISNFDKYEMDFFENLRNPAKPKKENFLMPTIFGILIILTVSLNVWLWTKK